jgi:hypothetical protein
MAEQITFLASLSPILSAITRSGDGEGMRVRLDIPETEVPNVVGLLALDRCVLEISVRVVPSLTDGETQTNKRTTRNPLRVAGG